MVPNQPSPMGKLDTPIHNPPAPTVESDNAEPHRSETWAEEILEQRPDRDGNSESARGYSTPRTETTAAQSVTGPAPTPVSSDRAAEPTRRNDTTINYNPFTTYYLPYPYLRPYIPHQHTHSHMPFYTSPWYQPPHAMHLPSYSTLPPSFGNAQNAGTHAINAPSRMSDYTTRFPSSSQRIRPFRDIHHHRRQQRRWVVGAGLPPRTIYSGVAYPVAHPLRTQSQPYRGAYRPEQIGHLRYVVRAPPSSEVEVETEGRDGRTLVELLSGMMIGEEADGWWDRMEGGEAPESLMENDVWDWMVAGSVSSGEEA